MLTYDDSWESNKSLEPKKWKLIVEPQLITEREKVRLLRLVGILAQYVTHRWDEDEESRMLEQHLYLLTTCPEEFQYCRMATNPQRLLLMQLIMNTLVDKSLKS